MKKSFYITLGVSPKASEGKIKVAFRRLAKQYHPDTHKTKEAEEAMRVLNEAYATLSHPHKRHMYHRQQMIRQEGNFPKEGQWYSAIRRQDAGMASVLFRTAIEKINDTMLRPRTYYLTIAENDIGLIAGISLLHQQKGDATCLVYPSEQEKRPWMLRGNALYKITKEGNKVQIFRPLEDFRAPNMRGEAHHLVYPYRRIISQTTFFGEDYLDENSPFHAGIAGVRVPRGFGEYLQTIKSLGKKLAQVGEKKAVSIEPEVYGINRYTFDTPFANREGKRPQYDTVRSIRYSDFLGEVTRARGRVRLVVPRGKEGQHFPIVEGVRGRKER